MEILQLRYFYESASNESFAKTAEKYMVPPTSVSASVKRLEKELGAPLFDRECNRIRLNDNGRRLQQSLCVIFDELDRAVDSFLSSEEDTREIKMLVRAIRGEITDCIIEYKKLYPGSAFKTVFDFAETDFSDYDIIIDEKSENYPECESFELRNMKVFLRVAKNHPLAGRKLSMKQLSNQAFVSIGENNTLHKLLINACRRAGFTPNIEVLSNDVNCCSKCVAAGIAIGLGREHPHRKMRDGIVRLEVEDFNERQTICAYYKKQANYGNVKKFLDFLKSKTV
ncbi:MAG: LysR family transcriptional regulator [Clostridia bacterium]|nr:LysR family transcriptional regulator [Clostridia bacterium]